MKITYRINNKVVGFITWQRIGKQKHQLIEMTRIEVNELYRNEGIGTKLFQRMLKKIKFRKLFLTTHNDNFIAKGFYEKMGMRLEAVLPNHYYNGKTEFVYSMFKLGGSKNGKQRIC